MKDPLTELAYIRSELESYARSALRARYTAETSFTDGYHAGREDAFKQATSLVNIVIDALAREALDAEYAKLDQEKASQ
ncbi:MAG: hypothetical protein JXB47_09795 [Anaerolineae bacterium]|nr:hypothetical protein [Anaerolineae bacterium]